MLLYSILIVHERETVADLNHWVSEVRRYRPRFDSEGAAGLPAEWQPKGSRPPAIYAPLARVMTKETPWTEGMLLAICGAMARWQGAGQQLGLVPKHLTTYKSQSRLARPKGPP